ncbi:hypothetical protein [Actinoplanes nipponensis]|uniref:Uncharacterized protein n=1 Tax=Actinoplanes nipponensis TaxID=135950 RepID=A0A919JG99_9ACTN|nr:hypothetical protein [Actinoplanes nipponensis]GIE50218.1 hypothetical protein Ani05nite_37520 [Actinoplanes nipponensis]
MARRSAPAPRFALGRALRFGPVEVALLLGGLLLLLAGLWITVATTRTADRLQRHGVCVSARILAVSSLSWLKPGRSATVSYVVGAESYVARLHYSGPRPRAGLDVPLCAEVTDPTTFSVQDTELIGTSTGLWLAAGTGTVGIGAGFALVIAVAGSHQWRFGPGEDGPRGSWRDIRAVRPRHLRRR